MKPKRIQRKRTKGWRMPENAIYVGRPTRWGNPYKPGPDMSPREAVEAFAIDLYAIASAGHAGDLLRDLGELRGKDLACWCPLDSPCHADVLLELANAE